MDRASDADDGREAETRSAAVRATSIPSPLPPGFDRVMLNFGLRVVDCGTTPFGNDYVLTCVFSAIMSANASPFAYDPREAWRYGSYTTPPPDNARRPANLTEISQILGIPYETARRYVNALIARGHCTRDARKGLLIPMDLLQIAAVNSDGNGDRGTLRADDRRTQASGLRFSWAAARRLEQISLQSFRHCPACPGNPFSNNK